MTPGSVRVEVVGEHLIRVVTLARVSFHSLLPKFIVVCETCRELLHEETAAPQIWIDLHKHEKDAGPEAFASSTGRMEIP